MKAGIPVKSCCYRTVSNDGDCPQWQKGSEKWLDSGSILKTVFLVLADKHGVGERPQVTLSALRNWMKACYFLG